MAVNLSSELLIKPTSTFDGKVWWLRGVCLSVMIILVVGGITRLTGSGLSMVDWRPVSGVLPPIGEAAWAMEFAQYKESPQYKLVNQGMSLGEFQYIFFWEYLHRVLGRIVGLVCLIPYLWFLLRGKLSGALKKKGALLIFLVCAQGLMGWYMVKSGLVDKPDVSQYRLTAHLGAAVLIYSFILWTAFGLVSPKSSQPSQLKTFAYSLSGLIFLMILSGGLVAGTKAGYAYPTWPLMGDSFIPAGLYSMSPGWLAAFEDITTIQFNHRIFAYVIVALVLTFAAKALKSDIQGPAKIGLFFMLGFLVLQVTLGISTLIFYVPVPVAAAHQVGAVALLSASLFVSHCFSNRLQ